MMFTYLVVQEAAKKDQIVSYCRRWLNPLKNRKHIPTILDQENTKTRHWKGKMEVTCQHIRSQVWFIFTCLDITSRINSNFSLWQDFLGLKNHFIMEKSRVKGSVLSGNVFTIFKIYVLLKYGYSLREHLFWWHCKKIN